MAVAIAWLPGPAGTRRRVAKPSVEEPDAAEPARPDLWGARVSNDPGLPDRVHRSSVPGGNPRFSPKISEVKATDQQRPAQAPDGARVHVTRTARGRPVLKIRRIDDSSIENGSPKVHVGPELAEGAPGGPVTGAFPGFSLGVLVMGQGPVEARGKRAVFSKARWARLCVRGAGSFHRACPFVTSGPRGALLHLPRVQLVKSRCPYDLRCTCVIFQPERWGPNSQTLALLRVRAHRGDHAL